MRPIVGITTDLLMARYGAWEEESALVPTDYVRAVERAGGRPVLIPPSTEGVDETLSLFDALCRLSVSGGLRSILHQPVTLTEPYDVKCKVRIRRKLPLLTRRLLCLLSFSLLRHLLPS